ncbi:MAG: hypothetical protein ACRD22_18745 [Terriglobia bacterium]
MKTRVTAIVLITALAALGGCSHSADQVPDYHTMVGAKNLPNLQAARAKCVAVTNEAEKQTNPWCAAVDKAETCNGYLTFAKHPDEATGCPKY